jgi:hypothetical protein
MKHFRHNIRKNESVIEAKKRISNYRYLRNGFKMLKKWFDEYIYARLANKKV